MEEKDKTKEKKKDKKGIWQRIFKKKKLDRGKIAVVFLKDDGNAEPIEIQSKKGFFNIKGKTYHEDRDCTYTLKLGKDRYPLILLPEWSMIPYGTKKWHEKPMLQKFAELEDHAINGIRRAELVRMGMQDRESKLNLKAVILIVILVIIGAAFLMGG